MIEPRVISNLQTGQESSFFIQFSIHSVWKTWQQGKAEIISPISKSFKQITQLLLFSCFLFSLTSHTGKNFNIVFKSLSLLLKSNSFIILFSSFCWFGCWESLLPKLSIHLSTLLIVLTIEGPCNNIHPIPSITAKIPSSWLSIKFPTLSKNGFFSTFISLSLLLFTIPKIFFSKASLFCISLASFVKSSNSSFPTFTLSESNIFSSKSSDLFLYMIFPS